MWFSGRKKLLILIALTLLLIGGGIGGFFYWKNNTQPVDVAGISKEQQALNAEYLKAIRENSEKEKTFKTIDQKIINDLKPIKGSDAKAKAEAMTRATYSSLDAAIGNYKNLGPEAKKALNDFLAANTPKVEISKAYNADAKIEFAKSDNGIVLAASRLTDGDISMLDRLYVKGNCAIFYASGWEDYIPSLMAEKNSKVLRTADQCVKSYNTYAGWGLSKPSETKITNDSILTAYRNIGVSDSSVMVPVFMDYQGKVGEFIDGIWKWGGYFLFTDGTDPDIPVQSINQMIAINCGAADMLDSQSYPYNPSPAKASYQNLTAHELFHFFHYRTLGVKAFSSNSFETYAQMAAVETGVPSSTDLYTFAKEYYDYGLSWDNSDYTHLLPEIGNQYKFYPFLEYVKKEKGFQFVLNRETLLSTNLYNKAVSTFSNRSLYWHNYALDIFLRRLEGGRATNLWVNLWNDNAIANGCVNCNFRYYNNIDSKKATLAQNKSIVGMIKTNAIDFLELPKYSYESKVKVTNNGSPTMYASLVKYNGITESATLIGTVNLSYKGNYTWDLGAGNQYALIMTNASDTTADSYTVNMIESSLKVLPYFDQNGNWAKDATETSLERKEGVTPRIKFNVKGPSMPTGRDYETGDITGELAFEKLIPGSYTVVPKSYPGNFTYVGKSSYSFTVTAGRTYQLKIPYQKKQVTVRAYEDKAPFGDGRKASVEGALKDKFQFVVKGLDTNNKYFVTSGVTSTTNGEITITAPLLGNYQIVYSKYLGSNVYYHTSSASNLGVRKVTFFSTTSRIYQDFGFRQRPVLALAAFTDKNGNMVKDTGEYYTNDVQLAFKIMRSDCTSTSQPSTFAYVNYYPNKSTEVAYKVPLGRYYVSQVQVGQGPVQWVNMPFVYQTNGSQVNGPILDYCNALKAPVRKTYRFVNWLKPTVTAYFTQINSRTGVKSMLTSSACKLEIWYRDRHILPDLFPDSSGKAYFTLGDRMNLAFKPVCGQSSHVFLKTPTQYYSYTEGSKKLYWDFTYYPNYINMGPSLIGKISNNLTSYGNSSAPSVLGAVTANEPNTIGSKIEKMAFYCKFFNPFYWIYRHA